MNKTNIVLAVVAVVAVLGLFLPTTREKEVATIRGIVRQEVSNAMRSFGGVGTAGNTFNTAKVASVIMTPSAIGNNGTSSSILNTDATDRFITDAFVACANATSTVFSPTGGVANWQVFAATTSAANANVSIATPNLALNVNVATGTYDVYVSTSTYTATFTRRWLTNSYLTFGWNATSSGGSSCNVGVHYIGQ